MSSPRRLPVVACERNTYIHGVKADALDPAGCCARKRLMAQRDPNPVLEFERVSRTFTTGTKMNTAVDDVSFSVHPGQVLGLLGPNGAGKTTCIKMAATLLTQSSGEIRVGGIDTASHPREARRLLGMVLGGDRGFYLRASALENLRFFAELQGVSEPKNSTLFRDALAQVGLTDRANDRVETFSRGMRQRLHIARAVIGRPRVLLLDEPSIGLDPVSARDLRELVVQLRDSGVGIVLTTHYMPEAEALSDEIVVMNHGRVIATGSPRDIAGAARIGTVTSFRLAQADEQLLDSLTAIPDVAGAQAELRGGTTLVDVRWHGTPKHWLLEETFERTDLIGALFDREATLEESYLALVEETPRD